MVKGVARRVVVVKSPDPKVFDEAIFIVREETGRGPGVTTAQLLREAKSVAADFTREHRTRRFPALPWWAFSLFGAGGVGIAWIITLLF